jgi:hypothetical protein
VKIILDILNGFKNGVQRNIKKTVENKTDQIYSHFLSAASKIAIGELLSTAFCKTFFPVSKSK